MVNGCKIEHLVFILSFVFISWIIQFIMLIFAFQESEPVYANITQIQAAFRSPPPVPGKGAEPTRVFANDWEMFLDSESGRQFYHNKSTGERTWKPPRGLRAKDTTSPNTIRKPPPVAEKPPPSPGPGVRLPFFNLAIISGRAHSCNFLR